MKWSLGFLLAALLCGGCAVTVDPPGAGVYVAPPPVVVEPGYHPGWYYYDSWHHRRYWRG